MLRFSDRREDQISDALPLSSSVRRRSAPDRSTSASASIRSRRRHPDPARGSSRRAILGRPQRPRLSGSQGDAAHLADRTSCAARPGRDDRFVGVQTRGWRGRIGAEMSGSQYPRTHPVGHRPGQSPPVIASSGVEMSPSVYTRGHAIVERGWSLSRRAPATRSCSTAAATIRRRRLPRTVASVADRSSSATCPVRRLRYRGLGNGSRPSGPDEAVVEPPRGHVRKAATEFRVYRSARQSVVKGTSQRTRGVLGN